MDVAAAGSDELITSLRGARCWLGRMHKALALLQAVCAGNAAAFGDLAQEAGDLTACSLARKAVDAMAEAFPQVVDMAVSYQESLRACARQGAEALQAETARLGQELKVARRQKDYFRTRLKEKQAAELREATLGSDSTPPANDSEPVLLDKDDDLLAFTASDLEKVKRASLARLETLANATDEAHEDLAHARERHRLEVQRLQAEIADLRARLECEGLQSPPAKPARPVVELPSPSSSESTAAMSSPSSARLSAAQSSPSSFGDSPGGRSGGGSPGQGSCCSLRRSLWRPPPEAPPLPSHDDSPGGRSSRAGTRSQGSCSSQRKFLRRRTTGPLGLGAGVACPDTSASGAAARVLRRPSSAVSLCGSSPKQEPARPRPNSSGRGRCSTPEPLPGRHTQLRASRRGSGDT